MIHDLKCVQPFFAAIADGRKPFDVRRDDRDPQFMVGDVLRLREWVEWAFGGWGYTGCEVRRRVTYVLRHEHFPEGVPEGWVVLGLDRKEAGDVEESAAGGP
jgi:hypothetical protein